MQVFSAYFFLFLFKFHNIQAYGLYVILASPCPERCPAVVEPLETPPV